MSYVILVLGDRVGDRVRRVDLGGARGNAGGKRVSERKRTSEPPRVATAAPLYRCVSLPPLTPGRSAPGRPPSLPPCPRRRPRGRRPWQRGASERASGARERVAPRCHGLGLGLGLELRLEIAEKAREPLHEGHELGGVRAVAERELPVERPRRGSGGEGAVEVLAVRDVEGVQAVDDLGVADRDRDVVDRSALMKAPELQRVEAHLVLSAFSSRQLKNVDSTMLSFIVTSSSCTSRSPSHMPRKAISPWLVSAVAVVDPVVRVVLVPTHAHRSQSAFSRFTTAELSSALPSAPSLSASAP